MPRERGAQAAALAIFFLAPGVALLVGILGRPGSPLPFVVVALFHAVVAAYLAWRLVPWARPPRAAVPRDFLVVLVIPGLVAAWLLVLAIASANGILGSALPRVRSGLADTLDVSYLLALGAILVAGALALGLILLLSLSGLRFRSPRAPRVRRERTVRPLTFVTGEDDSYWTRVVSPSTRVLILLGALVAALGVVLALVAGSSAASLGSLAAVLAPVPAVAWSVTQSLWRPDRGMGVIMAALYRTMVMPFFAAAPLAVVFAVVLAVPPAWRAFETRFTMTASWGGPPLGGDSGLAAWLGLTLFMGVLASLLAGLALSVFVVLPVLAIWRPDHLIADNQMSRDPADRARNVLAVRALGVLLPLVFVVAWLLVTSDQWSAGWWVGIILIPVGLGALVVVRLTQRPDVAARQGDGASEPGSPPQP